jgi:hypothetical protein
MKIIWLSCIWTTFCSKHFSIKASGRLIDWLVVFNIILNTQKDDFFLRALRLPPLVKLTVIYTCSHCMLKMKHHKSKINHLSFITRKN